MELQNVVKDFLLCLSPKEKEVLRLFIRLPNSPDIQPEVLKLHFTYGTWLKRVTNLVEAIRLKTEVSYDVIRLAILEELDKGPH